MDPYKLFHISILKKVVIGGIIAAVIIFGDTPSGDTECETGYVKVENVCEETCALGPCKELIKISELNNLYFPMENFHFIRTELISILRILVKILSIVSTRMVVMNSNVNVTKDLTEKYVTKCVLWIVA